MARNVFLSFDYDDVMAVNIVRNSDVVRGANAKRPFSDRSLYEAAKNTSGAIKRAIDGAVDGTSVTVVVTGEHTWRSYWVRYEIAKSLERGNGFIVVDIDGVGPPPTPNRGPNPLDNMMLAPSYDRTGFAIMEWDGSKYADYKPLSYVSLRASWQGMPTPCLNDFRFASTGACCRCTSPPPSNRLHEKPAGPPLPEASVLRRRGELARLQQTDRKAVWRSGKAPRAWHLTEPGGLSGCRDGAGRPEAAGIILCGPAPHAAVRHDLAAAAIQAIGQRRRLVYKLPKSSLPRLDVQVAVEQGNIIEILAKILGRCRKPIRKLQCGSSRRGNRNNGGSGLVAMEQFILVQNAIHAANEHRRLELLLAKHALAHEAQAGPAIVVDGIDEHDIPKACILLRKVILKEFALVELDPRRVVDVHALCGDPYHRGDGRVSSPNQHASPERHIHQSCDGGRDGD